MSIQKISESYFNSSIAIEYIDAEEQEIMRRLKAYGVTPTGNKTTDKNKLHEIELKEAEQLNYITHKFLTVTEKEQKKIQDKKREKRIDANPELYPNTRKGQKILGEQIYQAIKMKKDLEKHLEKARKEGKILPSFKYKESGKDN